MAALVRLCVSALLLVLLSPVLAQAKPNPSVSSREDGIIVSATAGEESSIDIAAMSVDIKLHGNLAETVIDLTLANRSDDEVEALFEIALPAEAVVTGYALDIKGVMIDGVLVDQPKARAVYEDEIRKGIDPGLAEVAPGNVFKTRVYPVEAEGQRRIRLRFVAPADVAKGFAWPLESDAGIGKFNLSVSIEGQGDMPAVSLPFNGKLDLGRNSGRWQGSAQADASTKLAGEIRIAAAKPVEGLLVSTHDNGRSFFQIAGSEPNRKAQGAAPERMRVYWDSSLSRRDDLLEEEMALVADVAANAGNPAIDLVRFSAAAPVVTTYAKAEDAIAALKSTTYRGGTSFRGLDDVNLSDAGLCLLFSDGALTIETDAQFRPDCRLMVITSTREANGFRLGMMARASRGQYLKLDDKNRQQLAAQIVKPAVAVVAVRDGGGRKLPFRTLSAPDGGWFVVGRAPDDGEVQLSIAGLGKAISRRNYTLSDSGFAKSNAAGVLWAAEELERLADDPLKRKAMRTMAEDFSVASPTMSLLVLEEPEQYLRADIKPPKGFDADWMEDYRDQKADIDERAAEAKVERLKNVREKWAERKNWWNTKFGPPKPRKKRKQDVINAEAGADAAAEGAVAPAPRRAATDAASASADEYEDGGENIIVTASRIGGPTQNLSLSVTAISGSELDEDGSPVKVEIADVLSNQPYLKALDEAATDKRLTVLAEQEKIFGALPAFYLDAAEWFRLKGDNELSNALMLSAIELPVADDETLLIIAFRLQRGGNFDDAIRILELLEVRTENRPQPKRSLALALIARGKSRGKAGLRDLERAFELLVTVALDPGKGNDAEGDFDGIETIALMEANAVIPLIEEHGGVWNLEREFRGHFDTDVRILIEWTNDDADIDLWVIEPSGEKTYYSNQLSEIGGTISNDMTNGFGPEEYLLRRALPGEYVVKIDGYSPDRLNPNGKGRVMVRLIRDFARANQSEELVDAELSFEKADDDGGKLVAKLKVAGKTK